VVSTAFFLELRFVTIYLKRIKFRGVHFALVVQLVVVRPDFLQSTKNTVILAVSVATGGTFICTLVAYVVVKTRYMERKALDLIAWLPWAIPGIVMSLALLWAWIFIKPFGFSLYGTMLLMIICMITVGFPVGTRIMTSTMIQISNELEESARVSGASWTQTLFRIWLPLMKNGLINGWILNFTTCVRVLAPVILLFGPQSMVLSIIFYEFWSRGDIEMASVVGLMQAVIIIAGYTLIKLIGRIGGVRREEATTGR
jgi:iron(III) transport system permease protein